MWQVTALSISSVTRCFDDNLVKASTGNSTMGENTLKASRTTASDVQDIEADIWHWLNSFVTVKNEFYHNKFAPCPYARAAVRASQVDVTVFTGGDVRGYIRSRSTELCDSETLSTRVMAFPPRLQYHWGMTGFVEALNMELISRNVFLNTGVTKTMPSRHPGAQNAPYFIVVANKLEAVLDGAEALKRTKFYNDWPADQFELVVTRRARMAAQYGSRHEKT